MDPEPLTVWMASRSLISGRFAWRWLEDEARRILPMWAKAWVEHRHPPNAGPQCRLVASGYLGPIYREPTRAPVTHRQVAPPPYRPKVFRSRSPAASR